MEEIGEDEFTRQITDFSYSLLLGIATIYLSVSVSKSIQQQTLEVASACPVKIIKQ